MDENFLSTDLRNNPENISRILAKQKPNWPPGTMALVQFNYFLLEFKVPWVSSENRKISVFYSIKGTKHGYHMISFGPYVNELVKRADPKGRPVWVIFDEDIAKPFGK